MIDILHRFTKSVLYRSETAATLYEAVREALALPEIPNLSSADLSSADLSYADLSSANLRSANLSYANLSSANLRYAGCVAMQIEQWQVWITPQTCRVGCQNHSHLVWRKATPESVSAWHADASRWWQQWSGVVLGAIDACERQGWPKESTAKADKASIEAKAP